MKKDHYYQLGLQTLSMIKDAEKKPSLLLHSCCAPCNCYPMLYLSEYFDLTLYFNNSNIYPKEEYQLRLDELVNYTKTFNQKNNTAIKVIITAYDNNDYNRKLAPYGSLGERSERCWLCYRIRMTEAFEYAQSNNFDYVTTVMTISRQKDSVVINQIGEELNKVYPKVKFLFADLKKGKGSDNATQLAKQLVLYQQQYCGCIYSFQEYQKRLAAKG